RVGRAGCYAIHGNTARAKGPGGRLGEGKDGAFTRRIGCGAEQTAPANARYTRYRDDARALSHAQGRLAHAAEGADHIDVVNPAEGGSIKRLEVGAVDDTGAGCESMDRAEAATNVFKACFYCVLVRHVERS